MAQFAAVKAMALTADTRDPPAASGASVGAAIPPLGDDREVADVGLLLEPAVGKRHLLVELAAGVVGGGRADGGDGVGALVARIRDHPAERSRP
jgi:hypothetical protein